MELCTSSFREMFKQLFGGYSASGSKRLCYITEIAGIIDWGCMLRYGLKCNYFIFPDIHNQKSYSQSYNERTVATNISKDEDLNTFPTQQKIAKSCVETSENKQKSIKPQEELGLKSRVGI